MDENEETMLLNSELMQLPGELSLGQPDEADYYTVFMPMEGEIEIWAEYTEGMDLSFYRNYVLATPYAGAGMYMLSEIGGTT